MPEPKNTKNAYVCNLLHATVTINKEEGTTPMFIDCPVCGHRATSRMGQVAASVHPEFEWFKPTDEEMQKEASALAEKHELTKGVCLPAIREHVNKGGLLMRKIN